MADNTLETLANIQSMIDITSERLLALRVLRLQGIIKEEIRSLEGKLLKQFAQQLRIKSSKSDEVLSQAYQSYPSLSKWLVIVGISKNAKDMFVAKLKTLEALLSYSDNEISKILDGLPDDKEDVRKICTALSLLRSLIKNDRETDGLYWDSWKKSSNVSSPSDSSAGVDFNENVPAQKMESGPVRAKVISLRRASTSKQLPHERHGQRYFDSKNASSLSKLGSSTSSLEKTSQGTNGSKISNDSFAPARPQNLYAKTGPVSSKQKVSSSLSATSALPHASSAEKSGSSGHKKKKRPGSIEICPNPDLDFVGILRPNTNPRTRKISQTTSTSHESSGGSPMSPCTPVTPGTPIVHNHVFPIHNREATETQHMHKSSRFNKLRAIKDKIKGKMGISNKLKRNKSEERLDEAGTERPGHKTRSDTCPDASLLIKGLDATNDCTRDSLDSILNSAYTASTLSKSHTDTFTYPNHHNHHQSTTSYFGSVEDLTHDAIDGPTRSTSSEGEAVATADESEREEDLEKKREEEWEQSSHRFRKNLMRQTSATSNVNEEWDVPWEELLFQERIGQGRVGTVYRGKWHGEVAIRVINVYHNDERKLRAFKEEVMLYKKTRHDNIELFMGSSMDPPKLAIITSYCRGKSLYEYIRSAKDHVHLNVAKLIAQHIAQGMGYLHSRGIVHKDLKSKNVFIVGKRVTITDFGIMGLNAISSKSIALKPGTLQIPDGWLCYMAPEIIRALRAPDTNSIVAPSLPYTKESDMYAFGTVWYELLTSVWPFQGCAPESIIWQVGNGRKQSLSNLQGSKEVKDILMSCWARDPSQRQDFSDQGVMGQLIRLPQAKIIRRSSQPIKSNKKGNKHTGIGTNDRMFDFPLSSVIHELPE